MIAAHASRVRAAISCVALAILVATGILAKHHEADVAHITDARTGVTSHASDIDCDDGIPSAHLHAAHESHADACGLIGCLTHAGRSAVAPSEVKVPAIAVTVEAAPVVGHTQSPLLLAAPKTSPPRRAA